MKVALDATVELGANGSRVGIRSPSQTPESEQALQSLLFDVGPFRHRFAERTDARVDCLPPGAVAHWQKEEFTL
jgi:hypothetical protein